MLKVPKKPAKLANAQLQAFADDDDDMGPSAGGLGANQQEAARLKRTCLAALLHVQAEGQDAAEKGEFSKALVAWDAALASAPLSSQHELYELRAQVLMQLGRDFEAIQAASKATSLSPGWAAGFLTLGRAQLNYGEPQLALRSFQQCLRLQPDHPEAKEELSTVQMLALQQERAGPGKRANVTLQDGG